MRERKSVVHVGVVRRCEVGSLIGFVEVLVLRLDRHCRSHNIAAECCVWSSGKGLDDDFTSRLSNTGDMETGNDVASGSCLMMGLLARTWNTLSEGDDGLGAVSSMDPRDSIRDGTGVAELKGCTCQRDIQWPVGVRVDRLTDQCLASLREGRRSQGAGHEAGDKLQFRHWHEQGRQRESQSLVACVRASCERLRDCV